MAYSLNRDRDRSEASVIIRKAMQGEPKWPSGLRTFDYLDLHCEFKELSNRIHSHQKGN